MKIGIITESFLPQINGVTNSVLRVLEHLANEGHQALVIAPESSGGPNEYLGHRVKRVPALPLSNLLPIGMPVALPSRKMEYLIDGFQPDVLHLASPFALGSYAGRLAKKLSIPSVSIYQTDIAGFARHYGLNVAHGTLQRIVGKIHSQTGRTLAPSFAACQDLSDQGVPNVHLWRRGVNTKLFHPSKRDEAMRREWLDHHSADSGKARLVIGYVGRIANEKRISDLAILDSNPAVQLVITGEGPARKKMERELPHAIFLGFKSGEELASVYASLDIFIHPGPNETFCQAVQEALASGVPCIVPKTGGPADLVSHGITGWVIDTSNPLALQECVTNYLFREDPEEMRLTSRASVEMRTWSNINNQLMNHYRQMISGTSLGETAA
jgi:phosphatidylinositol alpha 1,6-mannosyltransferase